MSAMALDRNEATSLWEVAEACKIVVLCEDAAARARAVEVFDRISTSLADGLTFAINCWNFADLTGQESAQCASEAAASADIIMFSTRDTGLPVAVSAWLDAFSQPNGKSEGALAFLVVDPGNPSAAIGNMISRLAQAAHRLGMDFIPLVPTAVEEKIHEVKAAEWTMTAARKRMVDRPSYSHWGLNE